MIFMSCQEIITCNKYKEFQMVINFLVQGLTSTNTKQFLQNITTNYTLQHSEFYFLKNFIRSILIYLRDSHSVLK